MNIKLYVSVVSSDADRWLLESWVLTSDYVDVHVTLLGSKKDQQCPLMAALCFTPQARSTGLRARNGRRGGNYPDHPQSETACAFLENGLPATAVRTGEQNKMFVQFITNAWFIVARLLKSEVIKGLNSHIQNIWQQWVRKRKENSD